MGKKKLETFWSKSMYLPTAQRLSHASRKDNECSTSRAVQAILKEYKEGSDPELLYKLGVDKMKVGAALLGLLPSVASVLVSSDCRSISLILWAFKVRFSQGGRRLPLRPFPHFADGREERFLVWALGQSKYWETLIWFTAFILTLRKPCTATNPWKSF